MNKHSENKFYSEEGGVVAYQGVPGAFSSIAVKEVFANAKLKGYATFAEVIESVNKDEAKYALLPIENSTAGRVASMHTLLPKSGLKIVGEHFFKVKHCLIGKKGVSMEKIKRVYSHPQALAQCSGFINKFKLKEIPFGDTAAAVRYISKPGRSGSAAIASKESASIYDGVEIMQENINNNEDNITRFIILKKEPNKTLNANGIPEKELLTSIFYKTKNIPAVLYKSLSGFATGAINVISLESFIPMISGTGNEASFYLEFEGGTESAKAKQALLELSYYAKEITILGTYKKDIFRLRRSSSEY